jgi:dienelactone hydrolase
MCYIDAAGHKQPIRSIEDWQHRRGHILASFQQVAGDLPGPLQRPPLDVRVTEETRLGSLTRRKLNYQSDWDDRVTAWLFLPERETQKLPAVLCLHQTTSAGKNEPAGLTGDSNLHYALELAQRGYATLAPDYPSFGEHAYDFNAEHGYASGTMKAVWDNMRAIDLLETLSEVDASRIGCIGHSLGGHNAIFTAAFDPRIKATVSNCGFCTFQKDDVPSWTGPRYMPRIATVYGNDARRVPFDFPELIGLLAPRPFLACAAEGDSDFDLAGVKQCVEAARSAYDLYKQPAALEAFYYPGPHAFPQQARQRAYEFLDRHLKAAKK